MRHGLWIQLLAKRQQMMPDAVAQIVVFGIRGVGTISETLRRGVGLDFGAAGKEQRTDIAPLHGLHGPQAFQARPPQEVEPNRLRLVVRVMRQGAGLQAVLRHAPLKETVAEFARRHLDGNGLRLGVGGRVEPYRIKRQAGLLGQSLRKSLVAVGRRAAQLEMTMRHRQFQRQRSLPHRPQEQMQQDGGVRAAAERDQHFLPPLEQAVPLHIFQKTRVHIAYIQDGVS